LKLEELARLEKTVACGAEKENVCQVLLR